MALQEKEQSLLVRLGAGFIGIAAILLIIIIIYFIKSYGFIGASALENASITVTGTGQAFAVPDVAEFQFTVQEEAGTVPAAQKLATDKVNKVIEYLKGAGIDPKDIQTTGYDIYPRYEYHGVATPIMTPQMGTVAPSQVGGSTRVLAGYDVSQSLSVKIRKTDNAGTILSKVGSYDVSNVSGLTFTVDDKDQVQAEAEGDAIADAKAKADKLANDLGVHLVAVTSFTEDNNNAPMPIYGMAVGAKALDTSEASAPELPTGQNKFVSNVTITYKIR